MARSRTAQHAPRIRIGPGPWPWMLGGWLLAFLVGPSSLPGQDRIVRTFAQQDGLDGAPVGALAQPNDQRQSAGQMVDGELRVELEAVLAEWRPRGPDGPRITTPAFAEAGGPPQVPGPLIRASAGTPIRVSVTNTLERQLTVRGLLDRAAMAPDRPEGVPPLAPDFLFADSLVVPAGETREVQFTSSAAVSSIYFGRTAATVEGPLAPSWVPGGNSDGVSEGAFLGALLIEEPEALPTPDERLLVLTQRIAEGEGGYEFKAFINGLSWPFTERLAYALGDTVRWRVINATISAHPMHLHGFHFAVDEQGNGDFDRVLGPEERRLVVTAPMPPSSSMRMTWVAEEPGNWLFHCHILRHMGSLQRFDADGPLPDPVHDHEMQHMGGLVLGITVEPPPGWESTGPPPSRRIDLFTGVRERVFGNAPELGFVVQEGDVPPPPDSTRVPGSPLVLHRGEPTEVVVHNRLGVPLSVHWHGLELPSRYDGVAHWSGLPGAVRPPILPGETASVVITPPRAGSFMYHVHSEVGHELSQGLYGPFLVLEPGETWDRERDRVFLLAARGAELNAPPSINGRLDPRLERFDPGETYRLRFLHISPDERKSVRLVRDGEPVRWRPLAKDGADLPPALRVPGASQVLLDVGETYDVEWTPQERGLYVLEVQTRFYADQLPPVTQRVPFEVGEVSDQARDLATRAEVRAAQAAMTEAMAAADCGRVADFFADGFTFYARGHHLDSRERVVGRCLQVPRPFPETQHLVDEIRVLSETEALALRAMELHRDEPGWIPRREVITQLWTRGDDGRWRISHMHASLDEMPDP